MHGLVVDGVDEFHVIKYNKKSHTQREREKVNRA